MTAFLIVRLPSRVKSLEAVEFMQRNDFFFRISSNSSLLKLLKSSEGAEGCFAAAVGLPDEFKLGNEEKQLIRQFAVAEVKEEVDSDDEYQPKNNADTTEVKGEVESDVEQGDFEAREEGGLHKTEASVSQPQSPLVYRSQIVPSTVTEQGIQEVQAKPHFKEVELRAEEPNFIGEMEGDEQRMMVGECREMADDELLEPLDADDSTVALRPIHNNDALFDFEDSSTPNDDLQMEEETTEPKDGEEDDEKMEEVEEEEELIEEQEYEVNEMKDDGEEQIDENMDDEKSMEEDSDEGENEDVSRDEESHKELHKKKKSGRTNGNSVGRHLFTCFVKNCSFFYKTMEELEEHVKIHSGKQEFFCDVCKKDFSSKNSAMTHIQKREKRECCGCGKKFTKAYDLLRHLRCHTGEKPFICKICGKQCTQSGGLKLHMLTHTGEKRFNCGLCNKKYYSNNDLKIHERTHTGEKPYECKQCDFKCNNGSHLKVHMRIHTGEKPFSCGYCKKRFTQRTHLKTHERTYTGEKPFECSQCGRRFSDHSTWTKHIRIHTGEKPYSCKECDMKFSRSGTLKEHMKRIHKS